MLQVKTPRKPQFYTLRDLQTMSALERLPSDQRRAMEVVAHVLPFRTNNYVVDELIDWERIPEDPVFQLTFPQPGMLSEEHFGRMAVAINSGLDSVQLREVANEIRHELNPHPEGQCLYDIPLLGDEPVPGVQHEYRETCLVFPSAGQTCHAYCSFCFRWVQFVGIPSLRLKPRQESTSFGLRIVENIDELRDAVLAVLIRYSQEALVEEFIEGREVCIGLLGNGMPECLPAVELEFKGRDMQAVTWEDKMHKREDEPHRTCPAPLSPELEQRVRGIALATFRVCHCRDYARVDIRIDSSGRPFVLEINSMASLGAGASYVLASSKAGYGFSELVCRIVEVARDRCFAGLEPRAVVEADEDDASLEAIHRGRCNFE